MTESFEKRKATRACKKPARGATFEEMRAYRKQRKRYWQSPALARYIRTGLQRKDVGQSKYMPHQGEREIARRNP